LRLQSVTGLDEERFHHKDTKITKNDSQGDDEGVRKEALRAKRGNFSSPHRLPVDNFASCSLWLCGDFDLPHRWPPAEEYYRERRRTLPLRRYKAAA
jgi:hypothetical protein